MNINIDYEGALDFEHCEDLTFAGKKLSELTNLINRVLMIRQRAKKDILEECATWTGEKMHKLSWENKLVRLSELSGSSEMANLWQEADTAYRKLLNKQQQVYEDINRLKKMIDVTPR